MSLTLVLLLLALGIATSQACSNQRSITLRWLRLGDLIGLSLLCIAGVALLIDPPMAGGRALGILGGLLTAGTLAHLMLVQSGRRVSQRWVMAATVVLAAAGLIAPWVASTLSPHRVLEVEALPSAASAPAAWTEPLIGVSLALAAWLTGGSLMTMLLGHAYLTSGSEMTQRPFRRLVALLLIGLLLRLLIAGVGGLWPWWRNGAEAEGARAFAGLMIAARFLMGLVVPLGMTWMALQCVRLRSNQSATGILYVSSTMILVGEFLGLSLIASHRLPF